MSSNTFGHMFRVKTFGGKQRDRDRRVVDGCRR